MLVAVVAEEPLTRAGLAALLAAEEGVTVVLTLSPAEAEDALAAVEPLDVVVWDHDTDDPHTWVGDLEVPVLVLVPNDGSGVELLAAGARGVLTRRASTAQLLAALAALREGLVVLAAELAGSGDVPAVHGAPAAPVEALTPREHDVLRLLAEGLPNKAIAKRLQISENTVKFHVAALLGKFGARSRTEVVTLAVRSGHLLL